MVDHLCINVFQSALERPYGVAQGADRGRQLAASAGRLRRRLPHRDDTWFER
ncbi:hypothetical protein [Streptomyces sp. SID3343]|uniref:hypothetical protein n=1 Tax=Streptomyces sp. SID3343 TaxID=2690260 RepID=UPI00136AE5EE|nr:hypothetical protein [Streptomyces sp. SID3343]